VGSFTGLPPHIIKNLKCIEMFKIAYFVILTWIVINILYIKKRFKTIINCNHELTKSNYKKGLKLKAIIYFNMIIYYVDV